MGSGYRSMVENLYKTKKTMNLLFVWCLQILLMLREKMLVLYFHSELGSGHAPFFGNISTRQYMVIYLVTSALFL